MQDTVKTIKELRKFGLVLSVPFLALGGFFLWREKPAALYLLVIGAYLLLSGLLLPASLRPVEKGWMAFANVLSAIMTRVILVFAFAFIFSPVGLVLRLLRKDLLATKIEKSRVSYWEAVDPDGPQSRPNKPF